MRQARPSSATRTHPAASAVPRPPSRGPRPQPTAADSPTRIDLADDLAGRPGSPLIGRSGLKPGPCRLRRRPGLLRTCGAAACCTAQRAEHFVHAGAGERLARHRHLRRHNRSGLPRRRPGDPQNAGPARRSHGCRAATRHPRSRRRAPAAAAPVERAAGTRNATPRPAHIRACGRHPCRLMGSVTGRRHLGVTPGRSPSQTPRTECRRCPNATATPTGATAHLMTPVEADRTTCRAAGAAGAEPGATGRGRGTATTRRRTS